MSKCRVPLCICDACERAYERPTSVLRMGLCVVHLMMPDDELRAALAAEPWALKIEMIGAGTIYYEDSQGRMYTHAKDGRRIYE